MEDVKEDFETVYIVTAPFTGNEEEIAASFIIDHECSTETQLESPLNENSCILTDAASILVENVCSVVDKEYASAELNVESDQLPSVLQHEEEHERTEVFNVESDHVHSDLQQDIEHEAIEGDSTIEESLLLGNKRKRTPENTRGYRYQKAEPDLPDGVEVDEYTCPYCLKSFAKVGTKKTHMRSVHNVSFRSTGFIKCIECDMEFLLVNKLRRHLKEVHELEMSQEIHKFPNMEAFKIWKRNLEKNDGEFFIQQYGPKKKELGLRWGYICHRSGKYRPSTKAPCRKRMFRNQGSFKMGIYCTAAISIEERCNEVIVKHWPQHYGHMTDMSTEKLLSKEQSTLQESISNGVPFNDLLEDVRENVASERIIQMALKKRNIKLLKAAFESEEYNPGLTDSESVDRWVRLCLEMEDSPVLCYRQEEMEDGAEEFLLVIMTEFQKQLLVSSEKKVVCVDCVHRKKGGRFYLTCISIMDECDVAFPVAFCISNKIDLSVVRAFLMSVKDSTGALSCTYFMSDNESFYFDAWKEVMNDTSKWLWSMWYFDYNIHIQLRFFRDEVIKKAEAYKTLRTLIECQSQGIFETMFKKFLNSLMADQTSRKLGDFLSKKYGSNTEHWAYCYRTDLKPTANFQLDVLHRTLRYCCREGRKKRLDKFIFVLMKFVKMKMLDRLANMLDEEKILMAIEAISMCHEAGLDVPTENISSLSDKIWLIRSDNEDENVYVVRDFDSCPERCKLRCGECDICVHMYSCSCIPSMINANLCQHIHAVVWKFLTPHFSPIPSPAHDDPVDSDENDTFPVSDKSPELLESVLKKTHNIYKKIRKYKWDLNQDSLNAIMKRLEELGECIEVCAESKAPPQQSEKADSNMIAVDSIKKESESNSNTLNNSSQSFFVSNPVFPQSIQNSVSQPLIFQSPLPQPTLNTNPSQAFYLPNQSVVLPQNRQPTQPYILIIPHDSPNNGIIQQ